MKLKIYFAAENISPRGRYDLKTAVRRAVAETLKHEFFPYDAEVSVTFCDNATIREKNAAFRGKDAATDVLSFPMFEPEELAAPADLPVMLGDIVISLERAAEQGAELGHSAEREVSFLTIHSVLHLLGYDHERSSREEEEMCRRQREIISVLYPENKGQESKIQ